MTKTYNGHKNYNYWNVSLWLGNDEGFYRFALECKRNNKNSRDAAAEFIAGVGADKTPDGEKYTISNVMAALNGLE